MKVWARRIRNVCLAIMMMFCLVPQEQVYAYENDAEVPIFYLLMYETEDDEDPVIISAFYMEDTYGTGKNYVVSDIVAKGAFDDNYVLYLYNENYISRVTNVSQDDNGYFSLLEVEDLSGLRQYEPIKMEYEVTSELYHLAYPFMEEENFVLELEEDISVSSWDYMDNKYYSYTELPYSYMMGSPMITDNVTAIGMMSFSDTDTFNGVLLDFTTLPFPEHTYIAADTGAIEDIEIETEEDIVTEETESEETESEETESEETEEREEEDEEDEDDEDRYSSSDDDSSMGIVIIIALLIGGGTALGAFFKNKKKKGTSQPEQNQTESLKTTPVNETPIPKSVQNQNSSTTVPLTSTTERAFWRIRGLDGDYKGKLIALKGTMLVGRNPKAQIVYPKDTKGISGNHCQLIEEDGHIMIQDLHSSFGTFIGQGIQLEPEVKYQLEEGDIFYLANPTHSFCLERIK